MCCNMFETQVFLSCTESSLHLSPSAPISILSRSQECSSAASLLPGKEFRPTLPHGHWNTGSVLACLQRIATDFLLFLMQFRERTFSHQD